MRIIGCDLHARQQTVAMLETTTGEVVNRTLMHEGNEVREFYSQLPRPVLVGIEAIGPMHWFLNLLEELGIECQVGDAAKIRAAEPRKQKYDRRDAELILKLLVENRFPAIWMPLKELLDLRALLLHRHHWVRLRTQIQNALQAIALANGLRRGPGLWSYDGQAKIACLPLPPHASYLRRKNLLSKSPTDLESPKPYELAIGTSPDGMHYQITLKRPSDMNDKATWYKTAAQ
jgi:transposase